VSAGLRAALAGLALALPCVPAAASVRVDDSGTIVSAPVVNMRWRQLVPGRGADHTVEAQLRVALRLNLAAWVNQPVRLYMVLAPVSGESVVASWRTQGRLLAGSLRSGARALVFDGRVPAAVLEETIELTLATDGRALASPQTLQFTFELDTP
jgi:hypothetical protein